MAIIPQYHHIEKKCKKIFRPRKIRFDKKLIKSLGKNFFWFSLGGILGLFLFISFLYCAYKELHVGKIYEGVFVDNVNFSGQNPSKIQNYFDRKNNLLRQTIITLQSGQITATISAGQINFGYDSKLLADQAMTIGRSSNNTPTNVSLMLQAYMNTINLPPAYHYSEQKLNKLIEPLAQQINVQPVDPLFNFLNGKVITFRQGINGKILDEEALKKEILVKLENAALVNKKEQLTIVMPVKALPVPIAASEAAHLGIKERIAQGSSEFYHSAPERVFNISLAASRLNGIIIKSGEIFSFDKAVGDISSLTGYKQAYVIDNGRTVLGDGGGVCQVSTTLFRAALSAGLPIIERHQHAYRVGYYEQDSGPGFDAAIYSPTVDLKFKNNTGHALLIQTYIDTVSDHLTFAFYGTRDPNRQVSISNPVILSQTPAPPPLYQDDPTLPVGQLKQVDFAANGADVYFTRTVTENGEVVIYDKFTSNYKPWQAVYLKGTKI